MFKISFDHPIHIYFIGIGGISMSGLAHILHKRNFKISGSDGTKSELTNELEKEGVTIYYAQRKENISPSFDLIVYTAAIKEDHPEYIAALEQNIPMISRAQLLGQLMDNYKNSIAVSGTHGKTTTTSMISEILLAADVDPTLSIGGILNSIGGNIRIGNSEYFLTEACEYTNSFLNFNPKIGIILNIEEDHLDFFKDIEEIRSSFLQFAQRIPQEGMLIINGEIDSFEEITNTLHCTIITYGFNETDTYYATDISYNTLGHPSFFVTGPNFTNYPFTLSVPGMHNISNALAAIAMSSQLGFPLDTIYEGLKGFVGTKRRFEFKGMLGGVTIVDDYAHHPTEIDATLSAIKNYDHARCFCVFQPHTYTRTKSFLKEFAISLSKADVVILTDIYAARETDTLGISSKDLQNEIHSLGKDCYLFHSFDEIENFILENCSTGDLLITMGAGDVVKLGEHLLSL
ncbi:MAG: UDP-N-acetylmuramate--L-alanine ligase [Lachnospiraceae bacterium]